MMFETEKVILTEKAIRVERVPLSPELQRQITRNLRRGREWPRWASRLYGAWLQLRFVAHYWIQR